MILKSVESPQYAHASPTDADSVVVLAALAFTELSEICVVLRVCVYCLHLELANPYLAADGHYHTPVFQPGDINQNTWLSEASQKTQEKHCKSYEDQSFEKNIVCCIFQKNVHWVGFGPI